MVYTAIKKLVQYGLETGLITETDRIYATNQLLEALKLEAYEEPEDPVETGSLEEILGELRDIGRRGGISCTCGCREWKLKINYSSVELFCAQCGGALKLPAATMSDIEDLCCKPTLTIRGGKPPEDAK